MKATLTRIGAVLFVSGFCSLVYQVAWLRLLRLVFGSSTAATAVVLAIFMGGLGLGGVLLGRRAERVANPLAFYARLELGIAATAAASPLLVALVRQFYLAVGGAGTLGLGGATVVRILLAVVVLGVPTTLMGGTLPAVAQAAERASDRGRRLVATFYGVNTLGAVAGAFFTTFALLELLGVRQTLWLAAALNLALAMVVRGMARRSALVDVEEEDAPAAESGVGAPVRGRPARRPSAEHQGGHARSPPQDRPDTISPSRSTTRLVLFAAGVVGFIFFLMELVWYRMLAPVLGGSSYTFGLILTVALLGIGCGGALYGLGARGRRPTLSALSWTCLAEAAWLALPYALGDDLAFLAATLRSLDTLGFGGLVAGWTVVTVIVVLPAAVISGYQFPLLVALLGSGRRHVASQVGLAYAWNTWGAIAGALAGGFLLLPLASAPRLWRVSVYLLVALGLAMAALSWRHGPRRLAAAVAAALAALGLCQTHGPTAFWRHTPIGAGRLDVEVKGANELANLRFEIRRSLVREAEGVESSVALMELDELSVYVNGKSDGSARSDAPTMVWSGLVGALLHGAPRRVLVIGLGTGTTAGWLAEVDGVERVDVVELEPAVGELAGDFAPITFDVLVHPKVRLLYGDGREYVLTTSERYDLIFSQPSNPYRAGVADLFSQDFYRAVAARLEPGGLFLQWLQGYEIDADLVRVAYSTLASVFPAVETWQVNVVDLLLISTREPVAHDYDRLRRAVAREPYRSALERIWRVAGLEGLYSGFVAGPELARHLAAAAEHRVSTDDRPLIEFGFARTVGRTGLFQVRQLWQLAAELGATRPRGRGAPPDWARVREARHVRQTAGTFTELPPPDPGPDEEARRAARRAYAAGDLEAAAGLWLSQPQTPATPFDLLLLTEALAVRGDPQAAPLTAALAGPAPVERELLAARLLMSQGDASSAAARLAAGFEAMRRDPWAFVPLVRRSLRLAEVVAAQHPDLGERLFAALERPFAVLVVEETRKRVRLRLAQVIDFPGRCVEAFAAFEPHVVWEEAFLRGRRLCYRQNAHPLLARAEEDLGDFLAAAPPVLVDELAPPAPAAVPLTGETGRRPIPPGP